MVINYGNRSSARQCCRQLLQRMLFQAVLSSVVAVRALSGSAVVNWCSAWTARQCCRQLMQCVDCQAVLSSVVTVQGLPGSALVNRCSALTARQGCRQLLQCGACSAVLSSIEAVRGLPGRAVVRCYSTGPARQCCRVSCYSSGPADDFLLAILPIEELLTCLDLGLSEDDLGITNVTLKVALKADIIFQEFSMLFLFNCPNVRPGRFLENCTLFFFLYHCDCIIL